MDQRAFSLALSISVGLALFLCRIDLVLMGKCTSQYVACALRAVLERYSAARRERQESRRRRKTVRAGGRYHKMRVVVVQMLVKRVPHRVL